MRHIPELAPVSGPLTRGGVPSEGQNPHLRLKGFFVTFAFCPRRLQELLATAAHACGAHARALLHYETHVRAARGGGLNASALRNATYSDAEVLFLQVPARCPWPWA